MISKVKLPNGSQVIGRIFSKTFLLYYNDTTIGYIKFFGKGIGWKHKRVKLSFSERTGNQKFIILFNYRYSLI